jgi:hypothetical protein
MNFWIGALADGLSDPSGAGAVEVDAVWQPAFRLVAEAGNALDRKAQKIVAVGAARPVKG